MKNDIIIVKTFTGIGYNFKGRKYVIKQDRVMQESMANLQNERKKNLCK